MKSHLIIFILFLYLCNSIHGQVMNINSCIIEATNTQSLNTYFIQTESDLDDFIEIYGACDSLVGTIFIKGNVNLDRLDFIRHIDLIRIDDYNNNGPIFNDLELLGGLIMYESKKDKISGFNNLTGSLSLAFHENTMLNTIDGFNSLDTIQRLLLNDHETSFTFKGFNNVSCISQIVLNGDNSNTENDIDFSIFKNISYLDNLGAYSLFSPDKIILPDNLKKIDLVIIGDSYKEENITFLNNVDSVGGFIFYPGQNDEFEEESGYKDLDFISNVVFYNGDHEQSTPAAISRIIIIGNKELSRCHVPSLCDYLNTDDPDIRIRLNAPGCNSIDEVRAGCAAIKACTIDNNGRNDVTLRTQTEVDDFITQYGACERVYGDVHIVGDHDLSGFNNIQALGRLKISGMKGNSFSGFDSLRQLQRLELFENDNLESIDAFGMLENVTEELEFHRNEDLKTINGFQNLNSVGSLLINVYGGIDLKTFDRLKSITNELMVFNNPDLISLGGLDSLAEIRKKISIHNNGDLNDLSALADLELSIDHITISANPSLSLCNEKSICNFLSTRSEDIYVNITNNNDGCNSEIQVLNACDIVAVHEVAIDNINIYPNPTDDRIYIQSDIKIINFSLYDLHGRLLKSLENPSMIELKNYNNGVYILVLETVDHQFVTRKVVKR